MELIALAFSAISIIIAIASFVYALTVGRRLDKQQEQINENQLDKDQKEKDASKQADFRAEIYKSGSSWKLEIMNTGQAEARNIHFRAEEDPSVFVRIYQDAFPVEVLLPGQSIKLNTVLGSGHKAYYKVYLSWDDNYSKHREQQLNTLI